MARVSAITSRANALLLRLRRLASRPDAYRNQGAAWLEGEPLSRAAFGAYRLDQSPISSTFPFDISEAFTDIHASKLPRDFDPSSRSPFPLHCISESPMPLSYCQAWMREEIATQTVANPRKEIFQKSCWGSWASLACARSQLILSDKTASSELPSTRDSVTSRYAFSRSTAQCLKCSSAALVFPALRQTNPKR